jgi:hypothetical protein
MLTSARHRRVTAWIAMIAMLAFALVPTLSRAMAFADDSGRWAEVCTPQGMKLVQLADDGNPDSTAPQALSVDHCGFCSLTTDGAALLPASATLPSLQPPASALPAAFLHAPRTLHAWASAQPRAPPARS